MPGLCLSRIISTQVLWGSPPSPARGPPTLCCLAWGLLICEASETKVWLCRVLQTLPKITPGNARMDEGVFPESYKF